MGLKWTYSRVCLSKKEFEVVSVRKNLWLSLEQRKKMDSMKAPAFLFKTLITDMITTCIKAALTGLQITRNAPVELVLRLCQSRCTVINVT